MENIVCCCYLFSGLFCLVLRQGVTSPDWPGTGRPPAPSSLGLELQLNYHAWVILLFFVFFFKFQHPTEISLKLQELQGSEDCLMDKHRHEKMLTTCSVTLRSDLRPSAKVETCWPWEATVSKQVDVPAGLEKVCSLAQESLRGSSLKSLVFCGPILSPHSPVPLFSHPRASLSLLHELS